MNDDVQTAAAGPWVNQNGSLLQLDIASDGGVSGWFESKKGRAAHGARYAVVGRANGALVSFLVDFRGETNLASITSFSGRYARERDGTEVLHTVWVLARSYEDAERTRPTQPWNTFLTNADVFRRPNDA